MSNVYDMSGKKKVIMSEKEDEDITYKEIMKVIIENATEDGCHQIRFSKLFNFSNIRIK